jgi:hypothetical protein
MMRTISIAALVTAVVLGCTPSTVPGTTRDPNVITAEDIQKSHTYNAYDAVSMLRPGFLNTHGATTINGGDTGFPRVYLNHLFFGDLQSLRTLDVHGIREIHFYNGTQAQTRFGMGNVSGVIEIISDAGR